MLKSLRNLQSKLYQFIVPAELLLLVAVPESQTAVAELK
jgi:hypothetical protein